MLNISGKSSKNFIVGGHNNEETRRSMERKMPETIPEDDKLLEANSGES